MALPMTSPSSTRRRRATSTPFCALDDEHRELRRMPCGDRTIAVSGTVERRRPRQSAARGDVVERDGADHARAQPAVLVRNRDLDVEHAALRIRGRRDRRDAAGERGAGDGFDVTSMASPSATDCNHARRECRSAL